MHEMYAIVRQVVDLTGGYFYGYAVTESGLRRARFNIEQYAEPVIRKESGPYLPLSARDPCPRTPKNGDRIYILSIGLVSDGDVSQHQVGRWTLAERMEEARKEFNSKPHPENRKFKWVSTRF